MQHWSAVLTSKHILLELLLKASKKKQDSSAPDCIVTAEIIQLHVTIRN